jgi:thiosulfate/3-mercaptopyruvate sulfurtransferase
VSFTTLVDVPTVRAHLGDPEWRIIDVRHRLADVAYGERAYGESHLPGAVFLHCDRDLSAKQNGHNGRHPLPSRETFAKLLGEIGIGPQTQVVVYDDTQGMIAGRVWWMLRWLGHVWVALLDGGWPAWLAAGGEISSQAVIPQRREFLTVAGAMPVDATYVLENIESAAMCLIDARSPDRYRGENEMIDPVGGHIPGAVNRFFADNNQAAGTLKPAALLRAEWLAILAGTPPEQVVHQCGSGVSACLNVLSMEVAGLSGSRLYAGSWSEWCSDPARPIVLQDLLVEKK